MEYPMQACVLHAIGDLRHEKVADPQPQSGEVLLRVGACGVCGSDIPRVFTKGTYRFPTIPGHELAGIVEATGPGVDPSLIGRRAAVFPLIPCRACPMCEKGEYAHCADYDYLGSRCDGGFAEYVRVPLWNLLFLPANVSVEEASLTEPAAVAVHALRQAGIDVGDRVLILGAGPIGLMVGMWAKAWGAGRVMLVDIDAAKLNFARALGFADVCNSAEDDLAAWVSDLTGGGADLVVEASGSAAALEQCMLTAKVFGNVVLMGNPVGNMSLSQQAYWAILRKQLKLHGTWNSSYSNIARSEWQLTLDFMASGRLDVKPLITHRIGLDALFDRLQAIRDRTEFSNKVLYVNPEGIS
ncbi:MAG: galactitol-1-phosphate 5-dehydrogenase [Candidatus Hydrogenedentes bacterium]|nr:galactitol-1-phosphate 5-dehydrogenase [Candidatus Hydrogenedentota bacterium]